MSVWINRVRKSKTMIFALMLTVSGVVEASTDFLKTVLTPTTFGYVILGVGVIVAVLRVLTTQPIKDK